jgi:phenylacetate-coenzyme A ligase PaaK-like adenylate-forming protein
VDRDAAGVRLDLLDDGAIRHSIHPTSVYRAGRPRDARAPAMLGVDHVTYCLPFGVMDRVADIYRQVFGLADVNVEGLTDVGDDEAGMRSVVLRSGGGFTVVLTEPRTAASVGQTQRFIDAHGGAGVQHIAVAYDSLSAVVPRLRSNGASFLPVPAEHLDASHSRMRDRLDNRSTLQREGILVDGDERGLLFQLFSKPVTERGTLFFELIQRDGATGFGAGNVRALFAAVEAGAHHRAGGSEGWSPALVRSSSERIPFYRDHLTGVDGHDFQAVPSFDKSMTTRYGRFPMSAGGAPGAFRVLATSGTSGHRLYVSFDEHEWRRTGRWLERAGRAAFVNADDVLLNTHCYGLWVGGPALDLLANRCGAGLIPLGPVSPSLVIELLRDGIGTAISATPSYMRRLVETAAAERCDLRRTPLRVGFIGAEPAETAFRQKLLSQLPDGFHWFELYGLTETGGPSVACAPDPSIPELILNTEEFLVEVLDPAADRPVPLGEVGELTITTRRADGRTPLVRYRTRDLVRATAGDINAPTRISRIIGRADQSLKIGGVLVYPSAVSEIMAELLPPSAEWRAIITRQNEDDELLIEAEAARDVCESVARAFRDRVGVGLTVTPMPAAAFARSREKTQRILVGSPAPVDAR